MIRGEKDVLEFNFQALGKMMKRKTKVRVGITTLNNRTYGERRWRPLLPFEFEKTYPGMCKLIKRCWAPLKEDRSGFDEIVKVLQGEIADEVRRRGEPAIMVYREVGCIRIGWAWRRTLRRRRADIRRLLVSTPPSS